MFEKVNKRHPDKQADRIAGAIVDLAYRDYENPRVAVEAMIGHGHCRIIIETSVELNEKEIKDIVYRIGGDVEADVKMYLQDVHLWRNQKDEIRCGDNGIFKGVPVSEEEQFLADFASELHKAYPFDGKFIIDNGKLTICQSNVSTKLLKKLYHDAIVNPLGDWIGGTDVDTGATNRKLGSDMGRAVTGGGLHGKDLSKADVSVNIYAHLKAQETGKVVELSCAIGDTKIDGKPYREIVEIARNYINSIGGFEKLAEWGLIR